MLAVIAYLIANLYVVVSIFFLMIRRPPRSTRTDTLFPYTTLFRSWKWPMTKNVSDSGTSTLTLPRNSPLNPPRSEEHTSELQSLMRISYAVFCLKKKKKNNKKQQQIKRKK